MYLIQYSCYVTYLFFPTVTKCLEVTIIVLLILTLFGILFAIVILCCLKKTKKGTR